MLASMFVAQKSVILLYIYAFNMCIDSNNIDHVAIEAMYSNTVSLLHTVHIVTNNCLYYTMFSSSCSTERFANNGIYCVLL